MAPFARARRLPFSSFCAPVCRRLLSRSFPPEPVYHSSSPSSSSSSYPPDETTAVATASSPSLAGR